MENRKFFLLFEQVLFISILQFVFYNFFHFKIVPSFYLVYLLLLVFDGEIEMSLFLSFVLGLINDIFSKDILGSSSVKFLLVVYFSSFFVVKSIKGKGSLIFIFSFLYFVLLGFRSSGESIWKGWVLFKYAFLFSLYNFLIGVIIETFMKEIRKKWVERIF